MAAYASLWSRFCAGALGFAWCAISRRVCLASGEVSARASTAWRWSYLPGHGVRPAAETHGSAPDSRQATLLSTLGATTALFAVVTLVCAVARSNVGQTGLGSRGRGGSDVSLSLFTARANGGARTGRLGPTVSDAFAGMSVRPAVVGHDSLGAYLLSDEAASSRRDDRHGQLSLWLGHTGRTSRLGASSRRSKHAAPRTHGR
jgi:hypothetical protein